MDNLAKWVVDPSPLFQHPPPSIFETVPIKEDSILEALLQPGVEECTDLLKVLCSSLLDVIDRDITLHGELSEEQRTRLMAIADKCPAHKTLTGTMAIRTRQV